jgi:DNA-binding MarR family transcriptional regulator
VWRPLSGAVEARWAERLGAGDIDRLKEPLQAVAVRLDPALPDFLPILGYGLWSTPDRTRPAPKSGQPAPESGQPAPESGQPAPESGRPAPESGRPAPESRGPALGSGRPAPEPVPRSGPGSATEPGQVPADLPMLSRVLLAFAIEFEHESPVSVAISANVLRLLDEPGVRVRDLPALSGVPKEAISMAMGILTKRGLAISGPAPDGGRWQVARLTPKGRMAQNKSREHLGDVEDRWQERFGDQVLNDLRRALERLANGPGRARLAAALEPPPGGWRASVRRPDMLPQYPMVLHRGGFPDGR